MDEWLQEFYDWLSTDPGGYGYAPSEIEQINEYISTFTPQGTGMGNQPFYGYQGMSPEISQALSQAFHIPQDMASYWSSETEGFFPLPGLESSYNFSDPFLEGAFEEYGSPIESLSHLVNVFDPESIAQGLTNVGLTEGTPILPAEVKALTPEMIEKTKSAYYEPYETSERKGLVEKLSEATSKAPTGGFAGSGARVAGLSGAEQLYRGGYGDLLKDIMKMRGGATEDVLGTIHGWQELLSGI